MRTCGVRARTAHNNGNGADIIYYWPKLFPIPPSYISLQLTSSSKHAESDEEENTPSDAGTG